MTRKSSLIYNLEVINPTIASEWHPTKNDSLTPKKVTPYCHHKVWWRCNKGHEWQAVVSNRTFSGSLCPYCSNKKVNNDNCLQATNPALAQEWHPSKNGDLSPRDITSGSGKIVWWVCSKNHEYHSRVYSRNKGAGCPYCDGKLVCKENSLETNDPVLSKEWDYIRNVNLTPKDVTVSSSKKAWWRCKNNHVWQKEISYRSRGGKEGCPFCSNRRVCEDNCLETNNSTLAKEWHPSKNGDLTPKDVTAGVLKNVWWLCKKGHEWIATVKDRNDGNGCPYCAGQLVCQDNCLQTVNHPIAKEWHPSKNGNLTPKDVTAGSGKRVWWICSKGHEWISTPRDRNYGYGCPYCSGKFVCDENCLQTLNPKIAKEWHPIKNNNLTPKDVTLYSGKKAWWICSRGHEWQAVISNRTFSGSLCPYCHPQTSILELRIYSEMKYIFNKVELRKKIYGFECDIYIPEFKIGIEVDGMYWHKEKKRQIYDKKKSKLLGDKGIFLIRIREKGLRKINKEDIIFSPKDEEIKLIRRIVKLINENCAITESKREKVEKYLLSNRLMNEKGLLRLKEFLPWPLPSKSLYYKHRDIALQWHLTKNGSLTPSHVTSASGKKVWWICSKGHEWQATIASRTVSKSGCPYCWKNMRLSRK